jgi:hypothetical protein
MQTIDPSLRPASFQPAGSVIIVFELTNEDSFRDIDDRINSFRSLCVDSAILIVVRNASDLISSDLIGRNGTDHSGGEGKGTRCIVFRDVRKNRTGS